MARCVADRCVQTSHTLLYKPVIFILRIELGWNVLPSYGNLQVLLLLMILQWGFPTQGEENQCMVLKLGSEAEILEA